MSPASLNFLPLFIFLTLLFVVSVFLSKEAPWSSYGKNKFYGKHIKLVCFSLAFVFASVSLTDIKTLKRVDSVANLFVFDVTPSQMVEDCFDPISSKMISRLECSKNTFLEMMDNLPETSSVALMMTSGRYVDTIVVVLPLTPVKENTLIRRQLELVDWWNAWNGSSSLNYFPFYLYYAVHKLEKPFNVIFFGDGGGKPASFRPSVEESEWFLGDTPEETEFEIKVREFFGSGVGFLFVGVGETVPLEVPRFNQKGVKVGCLKDIIDNTKCYTSALSEETLKQSAKVFDGQYLKINQKDKIKKWLINDALARPKSVDVEEPLGFIFGYLSLVFFVLWIII